MKTEQKNQQATGKRKTSVASFRGKESGGLIINKKKFEEYLTQQRHRMIVMAPVEGTEIQINGVVKVIGGGLSAQAEAIRHAISKFIRISGVKGVTEEIVKNLKKEGYLTRDSRKKERKKPGQEGARRNFQSQKR